MSSLSVCSSGTSVGQRTDGEESDEQSSIASTDAVTTTWKCNNCTFSNVGTFVQNQRCRMCHRPFEEVGGEVSATTSAAPPSPGGGRASDKKKRRKHRKKSSFRLSSEDTTVRKRVERKGNLSSAATKVPPASLENVESEKQEESSIEKFNRFLAAKNLSRQ